MYPAKWVMEIFTDGIRQARSYIPPRGITLLLGCKHVSISMSAWSGYRRGFEAPLSALLVMTTLKKAGPCSGPACGVHIGGRRLAVVSGDLDFAEAVAYADRDRARLKSGRHNGLNLQAVLFFVK